MEKDAYLSLSRPSSAQIREKSSRFLAFAIPAENEVFIREELLQFRKKYFDATHHCYAWRLGVTPFRFRANDDGEPAGTAGLPILGQIQANGLSQTLILVIRYYGGTKLGVPGLIHAYREAAAEAIANGEIVEKTIKRKMSISFPYAAMNEVMRVIKVFRPEIHSQDCQLTCSILLSIRESKVDALVESLSSFGKVTLDDTPFF
jgi:uncharacterized YigZ family protein